MFFAPARVMLHRLGWGALVLGIAFGCSDTDPVPGAPGSSAGAGSGDSAGAPNAGASDAGAGGSRDPLAPGGAAGESGEAGAGGAAAVHFWTDATQHIDIECYGQTIGYARFRADRAQLSATQLELLQSQTIAPGSTPEWSDDQTHCRVTTRDNQARERKFAGGEGLIDDVATIDGGASGSDDSLRWKLMGCEFRNEIPEEPSGTLAQPVSADPLCLREVSPNGKVSTFSFNLDRANTPYRLELVNCFGHSFGQVKVELFGSDANTPIAVGVPPAKPGPDQSCLVLDAQVDEPVIGRLVFASPTPYDASFWVAFR